MHTFTISEILCLIVVLIATITDWRTRKIPNLLTFPAALIGLVLNVVTAGGAGALNAVLGWLLGAAIIVVLAFLPIVVSGQKLGMGDAKLMAAVGAFLGWKLTLVTFFYFCLAYGAVSVVSLMSVVPWSEVWLLLVSSASTGGKVIPKVDLSKWKKRPKFIPIGFALAIGALCAILLQKESMEFFGL